MSMIFNEKVFVDNDRYIEVNIYGGYCYTVSVYRVKKRFLFDKREQVKFVKFQKDTSPLEQLATHYVGVAKELAKEWKNG